MPVEVVDKAGESGGEELLPRGETPGCLAVTHVSKQTATATKMNSRPWAKMVVVV